MMTFGLMAFEVMAFGVIGVESLHHIQHLLREAKLTSGCGGVLTVGSVESPQKKIYICLQIALSELVPFSLLTTEGDSGLEGDLTMWRIT